MASFEDASLTSLGSLATRKSTSVRSPNTALQVSMVLVSPLLLATRINLAPSDVACRDLFVCLRSWLWGRSGGVPEIAEPVCEVLGREVQQQGRVGGGQFGDVDAGKKAAQQGHLLGQCLHPGLV